MIAPAQSLVIVGSGLAAWTLVREFRKLDAQTPITLITRDPDAMRLRAEIRAAVLRLSLAALASTVTMGSLLFLAAWSPQPWARSSTRVRTSSAREYVV